jgi:hypothetical protein
MAILRPSRHGRRTLPGTTSHVAEAIQRAREEGESPRGVRWKPKTKFTQGATVEDPDEDDEEITQVGAEEPDVEESGEIEHDDDNELDPHQRQYYDHVLGRPSPPTPPPFEVVNDPPPPTITERINHAQMQARQAAQNILNSQRADLLAKTAFSGATQAASMEQPYVPAMYKPALASAPNQALAPSVNVRSASYQDLDRLWDWYRTNTDGVIKFMGRAVAHSRELFAWVDQILAFESQGAAIFRSIVVQHGGIEQHAGFVLIYPIDRSKAPVGAVHLYLAPLYQGHLSSLLPHLLQQADQIAPGVTLSVFTDQPGWGPLLARAGFRSQYVLTRPSNTANGSRG